MVNIVYDIECDRMGGLCNGLPRVIAETGFIWVNLKGKEKCQRFNLLINS